MITVFHRGDAPQILAALTELGYAFTEYNLRTCAAEAGWAAAVHLRELGRAVEHPGQVGPVWEVLTPTTTIDNALGRAVIAGDYPETVLAKLPRQHHPGEDGRCSCKTDLAAQVLAEVNVTEPRFVANVDAPVATHPLAPVCPECRAGKHRNCDGVALDERTDEIVPCTCPPAFGHPPRGGQ